MESIENQKISGAVIFMDDKCFINCVYDQCTLVYAGGDFSWVNTHFNGCKLQFTGSADRTIRFMRSFNLLKDEAFDQPPTAPPKSSEKIH